METFTVGKLIGLLMRELEKGEITKDTHVILTDDDEMNGVHALYAYSYLSEEEATQDFYYRKGDEEEETKYLVLG